MVIFYSYVQLPSQGFFWEMMGEKTVLLLIRIITIMIVIRTIYIVIIAISTIEHCC